MSALLQKIKTNHLEARREKNERTRSILTLVLGECEKASLKKAVGKSFTDNDVIEVISSIKMSNDVTISAAEKLGKSPEYLLEENKILAEYLPIPLTEKEMLDFIKSDKELHKTVLGANADGRAIGVVVKAYRPLEESMRQNNRCLDGKALAELVIKTRQEAAG